MNRLPPLTASARLRRAAAVALLTALASPGPAQAQFASVPAPELGAPPPASVAEHEKQYRVEAARHVYAAYPARIYKGRLPPLLYSVMVVETEIDAMGQVADVHVVRKPAADEVAPWVVAMIKRAAPYPAPSRLGFARFTEIWLVDKSGRFQVDAITEGQR
jgi:hypothetical protein